MVREANNPNTLFFNLFTFQRRGQGKGYPRDINSYDLLDQGSGCMEIRASLSSPRAVLPCPSHMEARRGAGTDTSILTEHFCPHPFPASKPT